MSAGQGQYYGYHVEVRIQDHGSPSYNCNGFVVTREWQRLPVVEAQLPIIGTPSELWRFCPHAREQGLVDYEVAVALAAQFHAAHRLANWALEFRLTKRRVDWSYKTSDVGDGKAFSFNAMEAAESFELPDKESK